MTRSMGSSAGGKARRGLALRSLVTRAGVLRLSLDEVLTGAPGPDELIVRIEAAPINPSDLGLLLASTGLRTFVASGPADRPVLTAEIPAEQLPGLAGRLDEALPVGNEGAGVVIDAGAKAAHLMGRTVAVVGGGMYAQHRRIPMSDSLVVPLGASSADAASSFINPLTALGMVETMRREGHAGLVHTAAASNLGQMLNRICLADGVPLVNVVRSSEQSEILRAAGARHVIDSSRPDFVAQLTDALDETRATLGFDAIGGGEMGGTILRAMEHAAIRRTTTYSRYGTTVHKQVYLYGTLDPGPVTFRRDFGMSWGMGGWLLFPFLDSLEPGRRAALQARVAAELTTTFASRYTQTISLADALRPEVLAAYGRRATGEKYLIDPSRGLPA